jgi:hypothetical protein
MNLTAEGRGAFTFCIHSFPIAQNILDNRYALINCIETELRNRCIIPNDTRVVNPEQSLITSTWFYNAPRTGYYNPQSPSGRGFGRNSSIWSALEAAVCVMFFEFEISNTYALSNLYSPDSAQQILKLPPPMLDENLKPIRRFVKVTKLSHETLSGLISKKIGLQKITEVIPQIFSYPFSAIVGTKIDSRAFSQVPVRTFECKLKKVLVPRNYFINNSLGNDVRYLDEPGKNQIYIGDWDGTFKLAWTNNPAWILMDLLVNKRYGLGNYIESEQVDIWELYKISRWCDGVDENGYYYGVPDSYGGVEPRHAFNALIQERFNIFDMINQIASIFRGHVYYMNSLITFDDDRLKPSIGEFNNSDVKDGLFNYTNHRKDEEFTAVDVSYIDEKDNYKPKLEYVEDSDAISKRGILKKEVNAFGITSRGQARRFGYHFLYQKSKENLNVSFVTDLKALLYKPGDLITIHDELMNSEKNYGTIKDIKDINDYCFQIIIDKALNRSIYDTKEITIYNPIAKPKFEDIAVACQFIPTLIMQKSLSTPFHLISLKSYQYFNNGFQAGYEVINVSRFLAGFSNFLPCGGINFDNCAQSFSGMAKIVNCRYDANNKPIGVLSTHNYFATLCYVPDYDIENIPSKYGHWNLNFTWNGPLTPSDSQDNPIGYFQAREYLPLSNDPSISIGAGIPDCFNFYFDSLNDSTIKYQVPHKIYFFEYLDTGNYKKAKNLGGLNVSYSNTPLPNDFFNFQIQDYSTPKISYLDILENDRPSIETYYIKNYETGALVINNNKYNEYTCITLYKSGVIQNALTESTRPSEWCDVDFSGAFNSPLRPGTGWFLVTGAGTPLQNWQLIYTTGSVPISDPRYVGINYQDGKSIYYPIPVISGSGCYQLNVYDKHQCDFMGNCIKSIYTNEILPSSQTIGGDGPWKLYFTPFKPQQLVAGARGSLLPENQATWSPSYFDSYTNNKNNNDRLQCKDLIFMDAGYYSGARFRFKLDDLQYQERSLLKEDEFAGNLKNYSISNIPVGSTYSLKLLNSESKTFKIMSITENYVNEYNISATEFNSNRFKEIEENSSVDDLRSTFNASFMHNSATQTNSAFKLNAPIILSLERVVGNNINYLEIKWRGVQGAEKYRVFVKTPSDLTFDFEGIVSASSIDPTLNLFVYRWPLPTVTEVGTYAVSLEAFSESTFNSMYKFSPKSSQSITVLSY